MSPHQLKTNNDLLLKSLKRGNIELVKKLIPLSDLNAYGHLFLIGAAKYGHTDIVKLLLSVSNLESNSKALRVAAEYGHIECVKLLIPVSDPKAYNSWPMITAVLNGHTECIKCLIPVSNCQDVVLGLYNPKDICLFQNSIKEYEAIQQQERLTKHIQDTLGNKTHTVKRKI